MIERRVLRGVRGGCRNAFTVGNGHHLGRPGNVGGAGRPAPRAGTWHRRAARGAGKPASWPTWCGEAGQGPSISYMEGPCLILPAGDVFTRAGTPATAGLPAAMIWGSTEHGRGSRAVAPRPEAVSAGAVASATDPCRTVGVLTRKAALTRKTGRRAVASRDAYRQRPPSAVAGR